MHATEQQPSSSALNFGSEQDIINRILKLCLSSRGDLEFSTSLVKQLIRALPDIDRRQPTGRTLLMDVAGSWGSGERRLVESALREIIARGAEVSAQDANTGDTALHAVVRDVVRACSHFHCPLVDILVAAGADINARNTSGETPLMASCSGLSHITKSLLDLGADPNIKGQYGATALHIASSHPGPHDFARVQLLLIRGADPCVIDDDSRTPLDYAMRAGARKTCEALTNALHQSATPISSPSDETATMKG